MGGAGASLQARRDGKPGIDISQFMYIAQTLEAGGNIKELSALLDYLNMKSEQQIQENKERDIQIQGQQTQQAEQMKQQGESVARKEGVQGEIMVEREKTAGELRKIAFERGGEAPPQSPIQPSSPPQGGQGPPSP